MSDLRAYFVGYQSAVIRLHDFKVDNLKVCDLKVNDLRQIA